jgi:hypothetical protein
MRKTFKKALAVAAAGTLAVGMFAGCSGKSKDSSSQSSEQTSSESSKAASGEVKVIRWGTHYEPELNPNYIDEATGEYTMKEAERQAALAALDEVKKQLNVEIEYVQYSGDVRSDLMTSVLSGNPICDLALIWGGAESTILAQNILQKLDNYKSVFDGDEYSWMLDGPVYGHNYFLSSKQTFFQRWPLVYNIGLLDKVDALKDSNGKTIYPTDLFLDGKWNWSTFKDYLSKINAYYANVKAPDGTTYPTVQAYETDYRFAGLSAVYAAGGALYDENGLRVDSEETIKGYKFIADLKESGLLTDPGTYDDGFVPRWCQGASDFQKGGTVFTDSPDWWLAGNGSALTERGESMGMVPYPWPDDMSKDDKKYRQVMSVGDSYGLLKGVDEETAKLAMESFKIYWSTYYKKYGNVEKVADYKNAMASSVASASGFDIFNENCGDDLLEVFKWNANKIYNNDFSDMIGVRGICEEIYGKGLYGKDGMQAYDVAIKANMNKFTDKLSEMEAILGSNEIKDNIAPEFTTIQTIAVPVGTSSDSIKWADYISAKDAVDGVLDLANAKIDVSAVDFSKAGEYKDGLVISISDKAGNEKESKFKVIVYDPNNKTAPTLTVKAELPTIKLNADASGIKWSDYVESATDAAGIDIKDKITADISTLDTTTAGEYNVTLTVTDYAGNTATQTIKVTVKASEG